jgi:hypothetical protein
MRRHYQNRNRRRRKPEPAFITLKTPDGAAINVPVNRIARRMVKATQGYMPPAVILPFHMRGAA